MPEWRKMRECKAFPFPREWPMVFTSTRAQGMALQARAAACAQEGWLTREVAVIWAIIPMQAAAVQVRGALFLHALQGTFPIQSHRPHRAFSSCSGFQWVFILAGRAFEGCRIVLRASVFMHREDRAGSCNAPSSSWLFC